MLFIRCYIGQIYKISTISQYYLCQNPHFSPILYNNLQGTHKERPRKSPGARLCIPKILSVIYRFCVFPLERCIFCTFCIFGVMARKGKVRKVQKVQAGIKELFIAFLILAMRDVAEEVAL